MLCGFLCYPSRTSRGVRGLLVVADPYLILVGIALAYHYVNEREIWLFYAILELIVTFLIKKTENQ